jgi:hypothetical protein
MVKLPKSIAYKTKEMQGDLTEDEAIRFESYLLSMGITNLVTREACGSGTQYLSTAGWSEAGACRGMRGIRHSRYVSKLCCLVNQVQGKDCSHRKT